MAFVPRQAGLRERAATLLHLRPGARYTVRVAALNGVSGPAAAAGATYAQVTVSTGPGGKAARAPHPEVPAPFRGHPVGLAGAPPTRPREATLCTRTPPLSRTQSHPPDAPASVALPSVREGLRMQASPYYRARGETRGSVRLREAAGRSPSPGRLAQSLCPSHSPAVGLTADFSGKKRWKVP